MNKRKISNVCSFLDFFLNPKPNTVIDVAAGVLLGLMIFSLLNGFQLSCMAWFVAILSILNAIRVRYKEHLTNTKEDDSHGK